MRAVEVICQFRGRRRQRNNNPCGPEETARVHAQMLNLIRTLPSGVPHDTIIVLNEDEPTEGWQDFENASGGMVMREVRENTGGPFGAYAHAFAKYGSEYEYWMFHEDDVLFIEPGVFRRCIAFLDEDPTVGYVALSPISEEPHPVHCGGGFGVSRREVLERVAAANGGRLPSARPPNDYAYFEEAEIRFTNEVVRLGLRLANLPGFSPLAANWWRHESQQQFAGLWETLPYIYKVGL